LRILYIFPHPDDEAFGPAPVIHAQVKAGHQVFLQTWTKGGATKERHKLGLSIAEMGEIRAEELRQSGKVLGLAGQQILDFEDSGLRLMDPRVLEAATEAYIRQVRPNVVVTYPIHGVSGFHDHLVAHAVVKRVFIEMKEQGADYLQRLAFFTLPEGPACPTSHNQRTHLHRTPQAFIGCVYQLQPDNLEALHQSLACYPTYQDVIEETGVVKTIGNRVYFELFGESYPEPLSNLFEGLTEPEKEISLK
jgi:LmbE family N-acetylglucosaminyl deacetylase